MPEHACVLFDERKTGGVGLLAQGAPSNTPELAADHAPHLVKDDPAETKRPLPRPSFHLPTKTIPSYFGCGESRAHSCLKVVVAVALTARTWRGIA